MKQDLADARDATADSGANAMGMRQMAIHTKKCEQTASELDKFAQKKMDIDKMVAQAQAQMKECRTTMARKGGWRFFFKFTIILTKSRRRQEF